MTIWAPDLSSRSGPLYLSIVEALAEDTSRGTLAAGQRLPTHRELADRLGVTVGTVTRAYAEAARRGLVSGEVGRGTFARGRAVVEPPSSAPERDTSRVDMSVNHPPVSGDLDPGPLLARTMAQLAQSTRELNGLMGYAPDGGSEPHRAAGAEWIRRAGLEATADQVLVTSGSQHGLTAVLATLLRPGDLVLTESLTYAGMKALAELLHVRLQGLPMDAQGLRPDAFEDACRTGAARALYCVPTLQNPTAAVMPESRRREIAAIARAHGVLIVEDDVYGLMLDPAPPPLTSFAPEISYYLTGTAKILAPGLRVGYLLAPPGEWARLSGGVRATTWMAAPLMAEIAARWIADGTADEARRRKRAEMTARQAVAREVLARFRVQAQPESFHLWLSLPDPWRSDSFAAHARRRGVLVNPAQTFLVGPGAAPNAVRVCLGPPRDREQLRRGLRTLADAVDERPEAMAMIV
ncbi:MAG TPA: PLP-dependent aminotransferase family protein [Vicinamibacteria bacterium]|nr:PLP-dependent aminotransferase family protein [Vicinamibacteria bacterium]